MGAPLVAETVKNLPAKQKTWVQSLGQEDSLEKGMAAHSSILLKVTQDLNSMYVYDRQDIKVWDAIYFQTPFINKLFWYPLESTPDSQNKSFKSYQDFNIYNKCIILITRYKSDLSLLILSYEI